VEKFELLLTVLRDLQTVGILKHLVLVGSWCQEFYRYLYGNPVDIPAARTVDADLLIPKRLPTDARADIVQIMEKNGFAVQVGLLTEAYLFTHPDLKVDFLTDPGAKADEDVHKFKQLGITAQELRYMSIPLEYRQSITYKDLTLSIPEPESFTLHKLIVCCLRKNPEKATKDTATAKGMLMFFSDKPHHIQRLHQIYDRFPKGWRKRVDDGLKRAGMPLPE
jgi:hypothetical protein